MKKYQSFADRVRAIRTAAGIGSRELSIAVGAGPSLVSHIETGVIRRPRADVVLNIAVALGTSATHLYMGTDRAPTPSETRAAFAKMQKAEQATAAHD